MVTLPYSSQFDKLGTKAAEHYDPTSWGSHLTCSV